MKGERVLLLSVIIIGRNEGERLKKCLHSAQAIELNGAFEVIYVDSGSSDGSVALAKSLGARVLEVTHARPTAARGRNLGLSEAHAEFVFFLDGDTVIEPKFAAKALAYLSDHEKTAVVWGHRRELRPNESIYNRVLDLDWIYPAGETSFCGGDTVMRSSVLKEVGPFREDLVAGEEPELCNRIRGAGYRIFHMDTPMTAHDLAIHSFKGYWLRCYRAGHAYAEVAGITHGETFGSESKRNRIQGLAYLVIPILLPVIGLLGVVPLPWWWGLAALVLGAGTVALRTTWRARWRGASPFTTLLYAIHSHFCQIPIWFGQILFRNKRENAGAIIEYK